MPLYSVVMCVMLSNAMMDHAIMQCRDVCHVVPCNVGPCHHAVMVCVMMRVDACHNRRAANIITIAWAVSKIKRTWKVCTHAS